MKKILFLIFLLLCVSTVLAHGEVEDEHDMMDMHEDMHEEGIPLTWYFMVGFTTAMGIALVAILYWLWRR